MDSVQYVLLHTEFCLIYTIRGPVCALPNSIKMLFFSIYLALSADLPLPCAATQMYDNVKILCD